MTVDQFITEHGDKKFPHSEALFAAIQNHVCILHPASDKSDDWVPASSLLSIYRRRADWLGHYQSEHALALREDVLHFCEELQCSNDAKCRIWNFIFPKGRNLIVFEGRPSGNVLGCLKTVDRTQVSEVEWNRLWGTDGLERT